MRRATATPSPPSGSPRRKPASMSPATMSRVLGILATRAAAWTPTAVAEFAAVQPDPFRVLIACLLSLRTQDATTRPAAARLFQLADTPAAMLALPRRTIERAIFPVGFYRTKAGVVHGVCRDLLARFGGAVPDDLDALLTLKGVGRKTANLVVSVGFGKPGICVDTHVHRISNRLGFVRTRRPDETELALRRKLPPRFWIAYNDLLVTFGQNVCRPLSPHCSSCPVGSLCRRVGVTYAR